MDALMLLTADHNRVRGLFTRFQQAHEKGDTQMEAELGEQIATELQVHTKIEEEIFYPAVRDAYEGSDEEVGEAVEEHHVVDVLLEELSGLTPGDEAYSNKMTVLIENVEHHAGEEEQDMFPHVRRALGADALGELAERLEARKAELGAPTVADKEYLSADDLKALASEQQIPGRSQMDREELMATVAPK